MKNTISETKKDVKIKVVMPNEAWKKNSAIAKNAYETIVLLEEATRDFYNTYGDKFVFLDKKTESLKSSLKDMIKPKEPIDSFKQFKDLIYSNIKGELYLYAERILCVVEAVNCIEDMFTNSEKIPKAIFKIKNIAPFIVELDIKNSNELNKVLEPGVLMYASCNFLQKLAYDFKKEKKHNPPSYSLSSNIKTVCFTEEKNMHEITPSFNGTNYVLEVLLQDGLRSARSLDEIIKISNDVAKVKITLNHKNDFNQDIVNEKQKP